MSVPYISNSDVDRQEMLKAIGVKSVEELFEDIPLSHRDPALDILPALAEMDLKRHMGRMASKNVSLDTTPSFLGGGCYRHFVPSVVPHIIGRSEFYTSYTPYQPEVSQGNLQAMFEYQSLICQLTGMEVSNAGMYDGATAMAEAALMAVRVTGKHRMAVLNTVNPTYKEVLKSYGTGPRLEIVEGMWDEDVLDDSYACVIVQSPNYFGYIEDLEHLERLAHSSGALLIVFTDPISLGLFRTPGDYGADIVVGEGQALGAGLNYGGPGFGIFASKDEYLRQMPARIIGRTADSKGRTGYVMTLQTREQHIRRERATSNICTSQTLLTVAAAVYLSLMGPTGLRKVAELCYHKAHYAAGGIESLAGYGLPFKGVFFKEFVVSCPIPPEEVNSYLLSRGIIGGLDISHYVKNGMLFCVTEMNSKDDIDLLIDELSRIGGAL